ncbi:MAG: hypothetical protein DA408_20755, partial [Bacteroidetes bacterium]
MTTNLHRKNQGRSTAFQLPGRLASWGPFCLLLLAFLLWGQVPLNAQCTFAEEYTISEHYQFGDYCGPTTSRSGVLDVGDPTFTRPPATEDPGAPPTCYYERFDFSIDAVDLYTFSMAGVFGQDLYFALYQGGFDPNNPLNNLLATDDDGGPGFNPELMIQLMLIPGNYTLVTTTFFSLDAAGAYSYTVSSASGGNIYGCPGLASPRLSLQESIALGFPPGTTLTAESPLL